MGRFCAICGHSRPHEQFGARGERAVVCRRCRQRPREEQARIFLTDEILGFLDPSNVSAKNLRRLEQLEAEAPEDVAVLASLVRQIAQVRPRKRRRWKLLRQQHPVLFRLAAEAGFLEDLEPEQLGEPQVDVWNKELDLDGWIEPWPWEIEPTSEEYVASWRASREDRVSLLGSLSSSPASAAEDSVECWPENTFS